MEKLEKVVALTRELVLAEQRVASLRGELEVLVKGGVEDDDPEEGAPELSPEQHEVLRFASEHGVNLRGDVRRWAFSFWVLQGVDSAAYASTFIPQLTDTAAWAALRGLVTVGVAVRVNRGLYRLQPGLVAVFKAAGYR